jgi:hypothetical protein
MKSRKGSDDRHTRRAARPALEPMESRQLLSYMGTGHIQKPGHNHPGHLQVEDLQKATPAVSPAAGVAPLLLQRPDLKITSLYLSGQGSSRCLNVVLTNRGTAAAYNVDLKLKQKTAIVGVGDGRIVNYPSYVSVIQPGQTITLTFNIQVTFGRADQPPMVYTAEADPKNLIPELNEDNNTGQVYS